MITSITQGGVSPRPGHAYTNVISRDIDREVINLGFCGSGTMELSIGRQMTKIDAAVYIVDCDWNMNPTSIAQNAIPLVKLLRQQHPTTPIVLAEGTDWPATWLRGDTQHVSGKRAALSAAYTNLTSGIGGDKNLYLVQGGDLYSGKSGAKYDDQTTQDATFNNVHPTGGVFVGVDVLMY